MKKGKEFSMRASVIQGQVGLCLMVVGASAAVASEKSEHSGDSWLSGRVYFDAYAPARNPNDSDFRELVSSVWLTGKPRLAEASTAQFTLQADSRESGVSLQVREAFAAFSREGLDVSVGRQILVWGKSDAVNPTDFFSAKSYTVFNPDEEVRRTGTELLQGQWSPGSSGAWTLTGVYAPKPALSRLLIAAATIPTGLTFSQRSQVNSRGLDDGELGFKAAYQGRGWDLEVLAFRGWNHLPDFVLEGSTLTQTHRRQSALGMNASASTGKYVFRAESAYVWTENPDGANPLIQPTRWDSVVGVERSFGEEFRVQVQGVLRHHPSFQTPESVFGFPGDPRLPLARANALVQGYQFQTRVGATLRAAYTRASSGFEAELFILGNFMGGDSLVRPRVSYPVTDSVRLTGGLDWYGGPTDRPLGVLQEFNSVFTEAKVSF